MIKLFVSTFIALAVLVCAGTVYYWRDTAYDPSGLDMLGYLVALPAALTAAVLSPLLIVQAVKAHKEKKRQQAELHAKQAEQAEAEAAEEEKPKVLPPEQYRLNIFSAAAWHSFGENEQIIEQIKEFKSPELDPKLLNTYGLPMLSYRIQDLDELIEQDDDSEYPVQSLREKRIHALIAQQLQQHADSLTAIAGHLKKSAMFYDNTLAHEYRMHPGWINPEHHDTEEASAPAVEQVPRLNRLHVHILLAEDLIHQWTENSSQDLLAMLSETYGIVPAQLHIEHHFFSKPSAYSEWVKLLKSVSQGSEQASLLISADSEIDQECLDERFWLNEQYIAAEYASSWCAASDMTQIEDLNPQKTLALALNEHNFPEYLKKTEQHELEQFKETHPFLLVLDDASDIHAAKKLQRTFAETAIETHHFLFTKQNLGHTQNLSKVFGFMLGMHLPEETISMIYSTELESAYAFFKTHSTDETLNAMQQN